MGALPFKGETAEDMRAAILKDKPSPFAEHIPERLKWIVEKALRKDREDRYQTAREFFSDLRELQKQESASAALSEQSVSPETAFESSLGKSVSDQPSTNAIVSPQTSSAEYLVGEIKRHKLSVLVFLSALLVIAVSGGYLLYRSLGQRQVELRQSSMKIIRLTDGGNVTAAAISPDGNFVVYARGDQGKESLWLRQVTPTSEREIVPPAPVFIKGPTFSNDGNLIYYTASEKDNDFANAVLYKVPALGGTPRNVLSRVSSSISFSPDGNRFAFVRDNESSGEGDSLVVVNVDGSGEQVLTTHKGIEGLWKSGPAWSPDGKTVACGAALDPIYNTVIEVSVGDLKERRITSYEGWMGGVERLAWLKDGHGLVVIAAPDVVTGTQVWHLSYPDGEVRKVTNDLNDYGTDSLSLTGDASMLVAVQGDTTRRMWVAPLNDDPALAKQITTGKFEGAAAWSPEGEIVYSTRVGQNVDLWIVNHDGSNKRQLTSDSAWEANPAFSPDGRYIAFNSDRESISHIWRVDANGSHPKQLTTGNAEDYSPVFTPDGRWLLFASWRSGKLATWKIPTDGGEPVQLTQQTSPFPAVSPDGQWFACASQNGDPNSPWQFAIYSIEGGQPIKSFDAPSSVKAYRGIAWTVDGTAILYADTRNGVSNIWSQPINGGPSKQLTNFKSDLIFRFALSRDGKQLALSRGTQTRDVVLIKDFR
jgi:Tol biopolymer transport system component